ncbi:MAG: type II toxin-antitoxin system PemK/MazF family toxin [Truepera sp.]|nr:type II toxin-antitoxin system PemK/MazF family toxin [Truepera sp.]
MSPFPFTDQNQGKKRPAVIVSSDEYHRERRDVILLAITSRARIASSNLEAEVKDWQTAGLLKPSIFKPVLTTAEPILIVRKLGHLGEQDLRSLRRILEIILG